MGLSDRDTIWQALQGVDKMLMRRTWKGDDCSLFFLLWFGPCVWCSGCNKDGKGV